MPESGVKHGQYMRTDADFRSKVCMQVKIIVQAFAESLSKLHHQEEVWATSVQNLESAGHAAQIWSCILIYRDSLLYAVSRFQWVLGLVNGERWSNLNT